MRRIIAQVTFFDYETMTKALEELVAHVPDDYPRSSIAIETVHDELPQPRARLIEETLSDQSVGFNIWIS
jgi:hypothetical protein